MQAKIETLKAKNANDEEYLVYPRTLVKCVVDENGNNLEDKLTEFVEAEFGDTFATKTYVAEEIANAGHLKREIVTEIPTADNAEDNVIYMYKVENATGNDVYQEYQLINGVVELIGDTSIDLSGYVTNDVIENIENGAQQAGNAKTLDGHGAEYFAPLSALFSNAKSYEGLDFNEAVETGVYGHNGMPSQVGASNYPVDATGALLVFRPSSNLIVQLYITLYGGFYVRGGYVGIGWSGWSNLATLTNLANYLPLNGGGNVYANDGYTTPINLFGGVDNGSYLGYADKSKNYMGALGFGGVDKPIFVTKDGYNKDLLHTGNKPTGTYTGNGDATSRTINIGGFGTALLIRAVSSNTFCIVTRALTLCVNSNGVTVLPNSQVQINDITSSMTLTLATTSAYANESGRTYDYAVL